MKLFYKLQKLVLVLVIIALASSSFAQSSWQEYDSLRNVYFERNRFDTALIYAEKALELVKEEFGENDTLYADMLIGVVYVHYYRGEYDISLGYAKKEKKNKENHSR